MASLIAIPFLIGSVPLGLAVVGANHFLKDKRKTNKFLYWGGLTASAFGGWVVSNMLMTRYVAESFSADNTRHYRKNDVLYESKVESMICNCGNTSGWIVSVFDGQNPPEGCFNRVYDISCPSCHENMVTYQSRDSPKSPFKIVYGEYGTQITPAYGAESFSAEGDSGEVYALKKALKAYKGTLEDCLDGRYGTDDAESVMDDLEDSHHVVRFLGAESSQFPSMHYGDHDSDVQEKYQEMLDEWDGDDNPPSIEEWMKEEYEYDRRLQEYEGTEEYRKAMEEMEMRMQEDADLMGSFGAESKFKKPYMKGDKIDMKRGNDGRFRRRLVIPLEKNAETTTQKRNFLGMPHYFYNWIGGSSGNPIYYGYPTHPTNPFDFGDAQLIHYVHPLYDEDYVKTLVDKLNDIGFAS